MEEASKLTPMERRRDSLAVVSPAGPVSWEQGPRDPNLLDYFLILRKHQWMILTFLLTVVTIVTIASFKMKPVYLASARVEVDREVENPLPFQNADSYDMYIDLDTYIETQTKILQSETLAMKTIRAMDLARYPEFGGNPAELANIGPNQQVPAILGQFLSRLSVKRVPNSRLIEVQFAAEDPQLAALVVNTHLQTYKEENFKSRYDSTMQASDFLSSELEDLRQKMESSENAEVNYERDNQIWMVDANQNTTTQKLADLSHALTEAQTELALKEASYELAHSPNADSLPAVLTSPVVQDLVKQKSVVDVQYAQALSQFGPNYPKVQILKAQEDNLNKQLATAKQAIIHQIDDEYAETQAREVLLERDLNHQEALADNMAQKLVQYNLLKRDADTNKELYDGLLQKLKEAGISAGLRSSNIRVVDPALVPSTPAQPQKARNILLSLLVGLVGGCGLAFLREYLDNTVKSPDDVQILTGLPSLAVVPALTNGSARRALAGISRSAGALSNVSDSRVEFISMQQPKSMVSEAFRGLRTSLLLSQAEHPPQVILVTSALPQEGKTTAAANLAVTLAQLGDRTLLADCDLRKPGVHSALDLLNGRGNVIGLSSYLAGVSPLRDIIVPHPTVANLDAIPTGPVPPNPADLLSSHRMGDAIEDLRHIYKFIVIDSPPILAATDAVITSALADGVLLVVRSRSTPKEALTRTRELLSSVKGRILGVILNRVDSGEPDYYYSYRYYPDAYGHGDEPDDAKVSPPAGTIS
ncbi:MAG TPA: polysaccharide biosynthesis tyrosine autokinase [Candidatus Acidoferrales bacterium]|nr:polysaccharide biosynthesis tyrosine autokinase [Candidatus Acidoferrales bacterium]